MFKKTSRLAALAAVMLMLAANTGAAAGIRRLCATEDSPLCIWIGPIQGNRRGDVVVNGPELS